MAKVNKRNMVNRKPVRQKKFQTSWRQWLRYIAITPLIVGVVMMVVWLQDDEQLPVLYVSVEGEFEYANEDELKQAVKPYVTGSFLHIDVEELRRAGEALPWIKQIQVQRKWPDSLYLIVEEHTAVAYWGSDALLSSEGVLFRPRKSTFPADLAFLRGPEGSSKVMMERYQLINRQFKSVDLQLKQLTMDDRRAWTIKLIDGLEIKLGRADSSQRLKRFVSVYKAGLAQYKSRINTIDMRYTNGLAIDWKPGSKPEFNGTA